ERWFGGVILRSVRGHSSVEKSVDVTGIDLAARELFVVEDREKEGDRGADAADVVFAERALHPRNRLVARRAPGDELRDHRVVKDRDLPPFVNAAVVAHAGAGRDSQPGDSAGRGQEILI